MSAFGLCGDVFGWGYVYCKLQGVDFDASIVLKPSVCKNVCQTFISVEQHVSMATSFSK